MRGINIGKIAGFQISIDWSWLIIFFLVTYSLAVAYFPQVYPDLSSSTSWIMGVIAALLLFASVLAHELMHSVVARNNGIEIKGITLFIFGGMAQTKGEARTPKVEFWMAISGPLTSLAVAALFYAVTRASIAFELPTAVVAISGYLALINLILAIFNMVPGFPLDGGRVLRSGLWAWFNDLEKATRYASYTGQGFGYLLIAFGFVNLLAGFLIGGLWMIFIGWFLVSSARSSYEQVVLREALSGVEVERVMTTEVPTVEPQLAVDEFVSDYLLRHEYACYPVTEGNHVKGIVSIDEVRALPREKWASTTVGDIAEPVEEEARVSKNDDAWDALLKLATEDRRRLLVMDNGTLDGTVTQESILRLVRTKMRLGVA
ncbi:MAG TPA: site-2 protease family protein [Armatimonadota bacterium]|nr:site-2 protease family protein [Armatimonadota bacterium]